ncbi:MAG: ThuA domain-containing protein [Phycisphaeraceae bacterium]
MSNILRSLGLILLLTGFCEAKPLRTAVILQSAGFVHEVVKPGPDSTPSVVEQVLSGLSEGQDLTLWFTRDATELTPDRLESLDLIILYTTGDIPLDAEALDHWVRQGGLLLGIHCATDTLKDDPAFVSLLGAAFRDHPWNANDTVTIKTLDPHHPATRPYAPSATFKEEVYRFRQPPSPANSILIELDTEATEKKADGSTPPIAWSRPHGAGRVFYTSLGHREDVWRSDHFRQHLAGALTYLRTGLPRDPWVFRSVLNGNARMMTLALHDHLYLAFDSKQGLWTQAWQGDVTLQGAVYDGRHGPQPVAEAIQTYFQTDPKAHWSLNDQPITYRYDGYRFLNDHVQIRGRLITDADDIIHITETPTAHPNPDASLAWHRRITVRGLPADAVLSTPVSISGSRFMIDHNGRTTLQRNSAGQTRLLIQNDGDYTLQLTLKPTPAPEHDAETNRETSP